MILATFSWTGTISSRWNGKLEPLSPCAIHDHTPKVSWQYKNLHKEQEIRHTKTMMIMAMLMSVMTTRMMMMIIIIINIIITAIVIVTVEPKRIRSATFDLRFAHQWRCRSRCCRRRQGLPCRYQAAWVLDDQWRLGPRGSLVAQAESQWRFNENYAFTFLKLLLLCRRSQKQTTSASG